MEKVILSILCTLVLFPKFSFGCTCAPPTSFCESITDANGNLYPDIILRGKIIRQLSDGKKIKVQEMIYGDLNQNDFHLTLSPIFCHIYNVNELKNDGEYIFAITKSNNQFRLRECAISFLKIEDDVIKGKIAPGINSIDFKDLPKIDNCGNAFSLMSLKSNISIFPNPTADILKIKNINAITSLENLQISIFDTSGKALANYKKVEGILPEEIWQINIQDFSSGLYLIQLSTLYQSTVIRVVKQ